MMIFDKKSIFELWTSTMLNKNVEQKKYSPTPVAGCYEVLATRQCERKVISVSEYLI